MAKVLLCFSSHIFIDNDFKIVSYYEGLIKELKKHNNQVMVVNCAEFLNKPWDGDNIESQFYDIHSIKRDVKAFSPELIIAFNNTKLSFLEDEFSCPIAIWEADSYAFYNDKTRLKANPNRYHYFCLSNDARKDLLSIGAPENQISMINSGTAVTSEKLDKTQNVSFIGSYFSGPPTLNALLREDSSSRVKESVKYLANNFYVDPEKYLKEKGIAPVLKHIKPKEFGMISTAQNRNSTLNIMTELGLTLYGSKRWFDIADTLPSLALSFDPSPVYSLKHNQDIYNSSNINLNVSHAQAVDGFSWRVMDVMASSGCLLSSYNDGLKRFTKGYVDIPMFNSSGEAYMLARKLLSDESYRSSIIEGAQACIEERGRWGHRFKEIEGAIGVKLCDVDGEGDVIYLDRSNYLNALYHTYTKSLQILASVTPKPLRYPAYLLATKLGFSIDYHQVKSILDKK